MITKFKVEQTSKDTFRLYSKQYRLTPNALKHPLRRNLKTIKTVALIYFGILALLFLFELDIMFRLVIFLSLSIGGLLIFFYLFFLVCELCEGWTYRSYHPTSTLAEAEIEKIEAEIEEAKNYPILIYEK